jgi:hypothetical protein
MAMLRQQRFTSEPARKASSVVPFIVVVKGHSMVSKHKAAVTLALIALGYTGAAINYSYLLGLNVDFPYLCPICPEILSLGSPLSKFLWRTVALGTLNAGLFTAVGWTLVGIAFGLKRLFSTRPSH